MRSPSLKTSRPLRLELNRHAHCSRLTPLTIIDPTRTNRDIRDSAPETIERCAPEHEPQATLLANAVKNDCATRRENTSCCYSFEQRKRPNQLLTVEEFRHAPTDAKRLAGVISLAAVIGGPHPH